jgi:hypothetical protein
LRTAAHMAACAPAVQSHPEVDGGRARSRPAPGTSNPRRGTAGPRHAPIRRTGSERGRPGSPSLEPAGSSRSCPNPVDRPGASDARWTAPGRAVCALDLERSAAASRCCAGLCGLSRGQSGIWSSNRSRCRAGTSPRPSVELDAGTAWPCLSQIQRSNVGLSAQIGARRWSGPPS